MPDKITPALTAREWEKLEVDAAVGLVWAFIGPAPYHPPDEPHLVISWRSVEEEHLIERRHALAALALHGQPFGFTPRMLEALHILADSYIPLRGPECAEILKEIRAVRDRIAALLPPEGT